MDYYQLLSEADEFRNATPEDQLGIAGSWADKLMAGNAELSANPDMSSFVRQQILDSVLKRHKTVQENPFGSIIGQAAAKYKVDPQVISAMIQQESGGQTGAVSPKGAAGLMQLMPETAKELGVTDPHDPAQNIMAGARYLSQ